MTFEEWLQEVEVFSTRLERCKSDIDSIEHWLKVAFEVGYEEGYKDGYKQKGNDNWIPK